MIRTPPSTGCCKEYMNEDVEKHGEQGPGHCACSIRVHCHCYGPGPEKGGWHGQSPQTRAAVQALSHVPLTSPSEDQGRDQVPFYL